MHAAWPVARLGLISPVRWVQLPGRVPLPPPVTWLGRCELGHTGGDSSAALAVSVDEVSPASRPGWPLGALRPLGPSFNGRTPGSEPDDGGSSPPGPTIATMTAGAEAGLQPWPSRFDSGHRLPRGESARCAGRLGGAQWPVRLRPPRLTGASFSGRMSGLEPEDEGSTPSAPTRSLRCTSVGQRGRLIPGLSGVQVPPPLLLRGESARCAACFGYRQRLVRLQPPRLAGAASR